MKAIASMTPIRFTRPRTDRQFEPRRDNANEYEHMPTVTGVLDRPARGRDVRWFSIGAVRARHGGSSRFVVGSPISRTDTQGVRMHQLVVAYVAAFCGLVGYTQAATLERSNPARRAWHLSPLAWGVVCLLGGPIGALLLVIAHHRQRRRWITSIRVASPPEQRSQPAAPPRSPVIVPVPQRHPVPRAQSRWVPRAQFQARPQPHPSDPNRMYLFGVPQTPTRWTAAQPPASPVDAGGGVNLLPRREQQHRPSRRAG
jgi:hypothetical protein